MVKKFVFAAIFTAAFCMPVMAGAEIAPADLVFTQSQGGKYIYCNNHERIRSADLADKSNEHPKYIMNNEGLTADKYAMFVSLMNQTDRDYKNNPSFGRGFDVDVDVIFHAVEDTEITIERLGFEVPEQKNIFLNGTSYAVEDEWGCFNCWASYLGMPIKQINSGNTYEPSGFEPVTFTVKAGEYVWLSEYVDNYCSVPFARSVNIMSDFRINSGVCDVNVAALRSNGTPGDRSRFDQSASYGSYTRDKQYKGISDGLNEVNTSLSYTIDDSDPSGSRLPVKVYNHYTPEGNTITAWYTHLNPRSDEWSYDLCAESDILSFKYYDPYKKYLYGSGVAETEKDDYYLFDTSHTDLTEYIKGSGNQAKHIPNRELKEDDDRIYTCNLANYGVIYNYNVTIKNDGNKKRYLIYKLATSSNNIVYVRDGEGNVLDDRILSKGTSDIRLSNDMTCLPIPAQSETGYTISVVLTPNYSGAMQNSFVIADYASLIETYETDRNGIEKDRYFDGKEYYSWTGGKLSLSDDRMQWHTAELPESVMAEIGGTLSSYELYWTGNGYTIRPSLYDAGWYEHVNYLYRDVYYFDEGFNLIKKQSFGGYPQGFVNAKGVYYVKISGSAYRSTTDFKWWDMTPISMPCWNYGDFCAVSDNGKIKLSPDGVNFYEVEYKTFRPEYIDSYGEYYYYAEGRTLYLSKDGLNWKYVMFNNKIKTLDFADGSVISNGSEARPVPEFEDTFAIKAGDKYIASEHPALLIDNSPYIPIRDIAGLFGSSVDWADGTVTVDGKKIEGIRIIDETAYAPLNVLVYTMGHAVSYDSALKTAELCL